MFNPIPITRTESYRKGSWEAYSPKLKRHVSFIGDLEHDYWLTIETDPFVIEFCERPRSIETQVNGVKVIVTLSMWIKYADSSETFVLVQPSIVKNPIIAKRLAQNKAAIELWNLNQLVKCQLQFESQIRNNLQLLSNMKLLISFVSNRLLPIESDSFLVKRHLSNEKISLSLLQKLLLSSIPPNRVTESICWMIYRGQILSNWEKTPLGPKLEVWISGEN